MHGPRLPEPPVPGGFGFPLGFSAAILTTVAVVAAGATTQPLWALAALVGVVVLIASVSTFAAAIATAAISWALDAGFVLGRHGDLAFTPQALRDALVLGAVALIAAIVSVALRVLGSRAQAGTVVIPTPRTSSVPTRSQPVGPA